MTVQVNDVLAKSAKDAIVMMSREAHRRGGYIDILRKLEEKEEGLAGHIYGLAKKASDLGRGKLGKDSATEEWFLAICRVAETHLKAVSAEEFGHAIENVKEVLPCWPVFKSEIKRAIRANLDPKTFETYSALKKARVEKESQRAAHHNEAQNAGTGEGGEAGTTTAQAGSAPTMQSGGAVKVTPALEAVLRVMQKRIAGMTADVQDVFAQRLTELMQDFEEQAPESTPAEVASGEAEEAAPEASETTSKKGKTKAA